MIERDLSSNEWRKLRAAVRQLSPRMREFIGEDGKVRYDTLLARDLAGALRSKGKVPTQGLGYRLYDECFRMLKEIDACETS
jgi:hypothetical protein